MRQLFTLAMLMGILCYPSSYSSAQCPEQAPLFPSSQPTNCQSAANIADYINICQTVCFDNTGVGSSGQSSDLSCIGTQANDLYIYSNNPYANIAGYDGSLVFRWVDWPGQATGVLPPQFTVHAEVKATFIGAEVQSIDCTDGFVIENAICMPSTTPEGQFFAPAGTIPTIAELDPIVDEQAGIDVNTEDVSFWLQMVTSDGATGPMCLEVSKYESGFICGDATDLSLSGNSSSVTGSASGCLCESALYGGLGHESNNLPVPCGVESPASAWYKIDAPYTCNKITVDVATWGGADSYNVVLLSGVDCPGADGTNPITGAAIFTPSETLQGATVIEASACGESAITSCTTLPAGEYYVYVSGVDERPTFSINVEIENAQASAGTATSPQNNTEVCSGTPIEMNTSGAILPVAGGVGCTQEIAWFYSSNIAFNPYAGEGFYGATGTNSVGDLAINNTGCEPVTYYIKGVVSDDGTTATASCQDATNTLSVTVYPELGEPSILNNQCLITVAARCPSFTVNGNAGSDTYSANFADDGTQQNFVISNGLVACNENVLETVSCSGSCVQPSIVAEAVCDPTDPFNFYIDIDLTMGSANSYSLSTSDGGVTLATADGMYQVGPFANNSTVALAIANTEDADCNLFGGTYSNNCNPDVCPNLTSATASVAGDACGGEIIFLNATVDAGVINQDFEIQWYVDGVAIPSANTLGYPHTLETAQGCSPEVQSYSVQLTCLDPNAAPTTTGNLVISTGTITVYPIPEFGVDFTPSPTNCEVMPVDNCGGLTISYTPLNNPTAGSGLTTVNYTVSVPNAPAGCEATGSYQIQCPDCANTVGAGTTPADNVVCFGENFTLESAPSTLGTGYVYGYAVVTENPYGNLQQAIENAVALNDVIGPYNSGDTPTFNNGNDYAAGTYYFIPFVSLDIASGSVLDYISGNVDMGLFASNNADAYPNVPYCAGVSAYNICLNVTNNEGGDPIDNINGLINGDLNGGGTLCTNNYTGNPNGNRVRIESSTGFLNRNFDWAVTVTSAADLSFPTLCPTCLDASNPIVMELLPNITLSSITAPQVCDGDALDLTSINPVSNIEGTYTWYDADPNGGGTVITDPTAAVPTDGQEFFVVFSAGADATCQAGGSVVINTTPLPVLNPIAQPDTICLGDAVDLTALEGGVASEAGTYTWFKGNPSLPFPVQLTATAAAAQTPTNNTTYYLVFESFATGCSNQVTVTYHVHDLPLLNNIFPPTVCPNEPVDLTTFEANITAEAGTFAWYNGNPNNGGTLLTAAEAQAQLIGTNDIYFAAFTAATTGCTNLAAISFNFHTLPILTEPAAADPICGTTPIDLTALEADITTSAGIFTWYDGDPNNGGSAVVDATAATAVDGQSFCVVFTETVTGCSEMVCTPAYTVNPNPVVFPVDDQEICVGDAIDLTSWHTSITSELGTFTWYDADPATGATALTPAQSVNQMPTATTTYYTVFQHIITNCTETVTVHYNVSALPVLNNITPAPICNSDAVNLMAYQGDITAESGTIIWYNGNPEAGGTLVANSSNVTPTGNEAFYAVFTNDGGCSSTTNFTIPVYDEVVGVTASYDCDMDMIVVDYTNAQGGSGVGYTVSVNSPNSDGETLSNDADWTIIISDNAGCTQAPISGTVDCIQCSGGIAASSLDTLCCNESTYLTTTDVVVKPGSVIAWAITDEATGAVTNQTELEAADVFVADANNGFDFTNGCVDGIGQLPVGNYYFTPIIANDPNVEELIFDPANGCNPEGIFCAELIEDPLDSNWMIDPLIIGFPDGSIYHANDSIANGAPIFQPLLDVFTPDGNLPCLSTLDLYTGNPNGIWTISINNIGTGGVTFAIPDFQVVVDADSCSLITQDQVVNIAGISGFAPAGQLTVINMPIPSPPTNFPAVNANCEAYGEAVLVTILDDAACISSASSIVNESSFKVYPNPTTDLVNVEANLSQSATVELVLTNVLGQEILRSKLGERSGKFEHRLHMGNLPSGLYMVTFIADGQQITKQVMKAE